MGQVLLFNIDLRYDIRIKLRVNDLILHVVLGVGHFAVGVPLPCPGGGRVQHTYDGALVKYARGLNEGALVGLGDDFVSLVVRTV